MMQRKFTQHCLRQFGRKQHTAVVTSSHGLTKSFPGNPGQVKPVFRCANEFADKVALHDVNGEFTYRNLFGASLKLSKEIRHSLEYKSKERVAFLCPNDVKYVMAQWASWMGGHIVVPLSKFHPTSVLEYYLTDCNVSLIVTTKEYFDQLAPLASKVKAKLLLIDEALVTEAVMGKGVDKADHSSSTNHPAPAMETLPALDAGLEPDFYQKSEAMIIYTSGTTGPPKGVVLTHKNLYTQVQAMGEAWRWGSKDIILHCLPLHHIHGITNALLTPLSHGAKVLMLPEFNANEVWTHLLAIKKEPTDRVNVFMGVPTMYSKLVQEYDKLFLNNKRQAEFIKAVLSQKLRLMVCGSAPLPVPLLDRWKEISGQVILERYGMTETGMSLSNPLEGERIPGHVGTPLPYVSVRISAKDEPNQVLVEGDSNSSSFITTPEPGQTCSGDLYVKGPSVFQEYWNKPKATAKEFHNGWFKTGDTAQYKEGTYKILGRTSVDMIKTGGFKVSGLEVETCLLGHEQVADVAVVGLPDLTWGEKVTAVVVLKQGDLELAALRDWCKERLASYAVPTVLHVVKEIPRNAMGKVNKKDLLKTLFNVK